MILMQSSITKAMDRQYCRNLDDWGGGRKGIKASQVNPSPLNFHGDIRDRRKGTIRLASFCYYSIVIYLFNKYTF